MKTTRNILPAVAILLAGVAPLAIAQTPPTPAQQQRAAMAAKEAEARAATPYKSAEIMSLGTPKLIEILKDSNASEFAKAKACQRLAVVGDKTAVPALAALLGDAKLSHYARFGLEPISDPLADDALRDALGELKGNLLIGVINSIGRRKDPKALDALAKLMHGDDHDVAEAARAALGRIRSP